MTDLERQLKAVLELIESDMDNWYAYDVRAGHDWLRDNLDKIIKRFDPVHECEKFAVEEERGAQEDVRVIAEIVACICCVVTKSSMLTRPSFERDRRDWLFWRNLRKRKKPRRPSGVNR